MHNKLKILKYLSSDWARVYKLYDVFTHCYYTEKYFVKTLIFFTFVSFFTQKLLYWIVKFFKKIELLSCFSKRISVLFLASIGPELAVYYRKNLILGSSYFKSSMSSIQSSFAVNPEDTIWEWEYHGSSSAVSFNILKIKYKTYPIYSLKSSNRHFCKHRHWSGNKIPKFNKTEVVH